MGGPYISSSRGPYFPAFTKKLVPGVHFRGGGGTFLS